MPKYNYIEYLNNLKKEAEQRAEESNQAFYENVIKDNATEDNTLYNDLLKATYISQEQRAHEIERQAEQQAQKAQQDYYNKIAKYGLYDNKPEYTEALKELLDNTTPK